MKFMIAIVPGAAGGVALFVNGVFDCRPMPSADADFWQLLRRLKAGAELSGCEVMVLVERPGQPVMFRESQDFSRVLVTLAALNFPLVVSVGPREWRARFLRNPAAMAPGTAMLISIADDAARTDVIAYLSEQK